MWNKIYYRYGCHVSPLCDVDPTVYFPHPVGIVIGAGSKVGPGCVIYQNTTLGRAKANCPEYPTLGKGCIVYAGSSVLGDSELGAESIVGAHSMVIGLKCPSDSVLVGVPAKLVKRKKRK